MDKKAMYKIGYGLYLVTTHINDVDNGCIVNSVTQVTSEPQCIQVTLLKSDYTCELIQKSKKLNLSIFDESVPFEYFMLFGMKSGRTTNKFDGFSDVARSQNGIYYSTSHTNALICANVINEIDFGTHIMFICDIEDMMVFNSNPSVTYAYYQAHIKPAPKPVAPNSEKWVCTICGYVYDNAVEKIPFEQLPETWVCPLCNHPKSVFEKAGN